MARKRVVRGVRPSSWWTNIRTHEARQLEAQTLREALLGYTDSDGKKIPGLRKIYSGFDPANGFSLRDMSRWSVQKRNKVRDTFAYLKSTTVRRDFVVVKPKSKSQARALFKYTGSVDESSRHKLRRYVVHTESPKERIHVVKAPVYEAGKWKEGYKVESRVQATARVRLQSRKYFFSDVLGRNAHSFEEMKSVLKTMYDQLPEGRYALFSAPHGIIGSTADKKMLPVLLTRYENEYGNIHHEGFAELVLGFYWYGNERKWERDILARDKRKARKYQYRLADKKRRSRVARMWGAINKPRRKK